MWDNPNSPDPLHGRRRTIRKRPLEATSPVTGTGGLYWVAWFLGKRRPLWVAIAAKQQPIVAAAYGDSMQGRRPVNKKTEEEGGSKTAQEHFFWG
jgi:hypothetical protein